MIRSEIAAIVSQIAPFDPEEAAHIAFVQNWIASGADLFRTTKPATPDPHLVAYFLLFDLDKNQILLVNHKKANLWLPAGGHVEPDEHPRETVKREIVEELGIEADFLWESPLFLTVTPTTGTEGRHTDISLWYVLNAQADTLYAYDPGEFHAVQWFSLSEVPFDQSDPHMKTHATKINTSIVLQRVALTFSKISFPRNGMPLLLYT